MHVAAINIYPVKSLRGIPLEAAEIEPWGLAGDRRWLVVDASARFLTQREVSALATVTVKRLSEGLRLASPGHGEAPVTRPEAEAPRLDVTIFKAVVDAALVGGPVGDWLSGLAGEPCRLVYMDRPDCARPAAPRTHVDVGVVSFADEYPLLLVSAASLAAFNAESGLDTPVSRFRPNLVVDAAEPWAEEGWRRISIGDAVFDVVQTCGRCVITTVDQANGWRNPNGEPLRSLNRLRRRGPGSPQFGIHLTPRGGGTVRVGDKLTVLNSRPF